MARPKVVVVGGGPYGINACKALTKTADVTLIEAKEFHEIQWATLRGMVEPKFVDRVLFPYSAIPDLGRVVLARVVSYDASTVEVDTGARVPYDYLVLSSGSTYPCPEIKAARGSLAERKQAYAEGYERLKAAERVLIIGGGPVGVELAAEIAEELPGKEITLVSSGERLVAEKKSKVGTKSLAHLQKKGVKVILNQKADKQQDGTYLVGGRTIEADLTYVTAGARPNTSDLAETAPLNSKGFIKVLPTLQVEGSPKVFAIGDCNNVAETKLGYFAPSQAKVVAANITALAYGKDAKLKTYKPNNGGPEAMLVSLSRKGGVMQMGPMVIGGFIPTNMKSKDMFVGKTRKELGVAG